ncbi:MAG: hypothetical protein QGF09_07655, partial [Rhodospirillales bacterium]|nr:hypothetical protein [Rhodospirillales bacterium]
MRGWFLQFLKLLVAAGLILWLVQSGQLGFSLLSGKLLTVLSLVGLVLIVVNFVIAALRRHVLLGTQGSF